MGSSRKLELSVNGRARVVEVDPQRKLLDVLRNELRLTAAKYGCGEAQCGACTVLRDGKPVRSCTLPVSRCEGVAITTLEGLASGDRLHPLQQAFIDEGAMQCGYCTAGMIMSAVGVLRAGTGRSPEQIATAMRGNICRCGTYPRIVRAIARAASAAGADDDVG
jgi:aerobic-type carbon monoxide dehydrogenase small subunit (CoxS/CutS family)